MKLKFLAITFLMSLFLVGSAYAIPYSVMFDHNGTGGASAKEVWGFDLEGISKYGIPGTTGSNLIVQDLGGDGILNDGDTFTEVFTTYVMNGRDAGGSPVVPGYPTGSMDIKVDISLSGYIFGYSNGGDGDTTRADYTKITNDSYFTQMDAGGAVMYHDMNDNDTFDGGDINVATFGFSSAAPSFLAPTVWPGAGGAASFSVAMDLDTVNTDYFQDAGYAMSLSDLLAKKLILSYSSGQARALGIAGDPDSPDNTIVQIWDDDGIDMIFDAVPEPTTMLLFGFGLLGLAGIGRKKD